MWINPLFDISQRQVALDIVRNNPMATLVAGGAHTRISHMPLLLEERADGKLELIGHIPRIDPVADAVMEGETLTLVFQGPQSYVSPSSYVDPGLPTYNYLVAHLSGQPVVMQSDEELRDHLIDLTDAHEQRCPVTGDQWQPDAVAHARITELLPRIIGFRIPVDELHAKAKLGQNRSIADQQSSAQTLHGSPRSDDQLVATLMDSNRQERALNKENKS